MLTPDLNSKYSFEFEVLINIVCYMWTIKGLLGDVSLFFASLGIGSTSFLAWFQEALQTKEVPVHEILFYGTP